MGEAKNFGGLFVKRTAPLAKNKAPKEKKERGLLMANPYEDRCTVRIRVYLRKDSRIGRIDGPPTEGQNGYQELRSRPDMHGEFTLTGVYDMTGKYIPYFPYDLDGQKGIDGWLNRKRQEGFTITPVEFDKKKAETSP
jgi:hypothetical protein